MSEFVKCSKCGRVLFTEDADDNGNCVGCAEKEPPKTPVVPPVKTDE